MKKLKAFKGLASLTVENSSASRNAAKDEGEDDFIKEEADGTRIVTLGDHVAPLILGPKQTKSKNDADGDHGKGKLSAKQRRDLKKKKKAQQNGNKEEAEEGEDDETREEVGAGGLNDRMAKLNAAGNDDEEEEEEDAEDGANGGHNQPQQPLKRGKRNKMKKMKEKYKDQDEEDKERAIALLQAGGGKF